MPEGINNIGEITKNEALMKLSFLRQGEVTRGRIDSELGFFSKLEEDLAKGKSPKEVLAEAEKLCEGRYEQGE